MMSAETAANVALLEANAARADALVLESRGLKDKAIAGLSLDEKRRYHAISSEMRELNAMRERLLAACNVKAAPNGA